MRLARAYAFGVALSFAALAALTPYPGRAAFNGWLGDALRSASWVVAGLSALGAARDLAQRDDADGFSTLAALRGADRRALDGARVLAAALRIALGVCVPALAVLTVAGLRSPRAELLPWLAQWGAFIVSYAAGLGVVLALLARLCSGLLAPQARLSLACLVLVPELLRAVGGLPLPSLPAACARLITFAEGFGRTTS